MYLYPARRALTTLSTVGYGDITPSNDIERVYTLIVLLIGALVFGYLLSIVATLVGSIDPNAVKIQEKLDEIKVYLRWHRFPPDLSRRIRTYSEFYYSRKSAMDEDEILNALAPTLRRDAHKHLLSRSVRKLPLFDGAVRRYVTLDLQLAVYDKLVGSPKRPNIKHGRRSLSLFLPPPRPVPCHLVVPHSLSLVVPSLTAHSVPF